MRSSRSTTTRSTSSPLDRHRSHLERGPFRSRRHLVARILRVARAVHHQVDLRVGVVGIVVEGDELLHLAQRSEIERVVERAVTPAAMAGILGGAVLAVVDEEIGTVGQRAT